MKATLKNEIGEIIVASIIEGNDTKICCDADTGEIYAEALSLTFIYIKLREAGFTILNVEDY